MKGKGLGEARGLFRARKFPDVIRILEPEVFRYRENFDYFVLLGSSCLHTGDLGGAFSYLSRARQLSPDAVSALLGLAAIHFRRHETDDAIKRWLEVLELDPGNKVARRGMDLLRKGLTQEKLQELIDSGKARTLYPPLPARGRGGIICNHHPWGACALRRRLSRREVFPAKDGGTPGGLRNRHSRRPSPAYRHRLRLHVHADGKRRPQRFQEGKKLPPCIPRQHGHRGNQQDPSLQRRGPRQGKGADAQGLRDAAGLPDPEGLLPLHDGCRGARACTTDAR